MRWERRGFTSSEQVFKVLHKIKRLILGEDFKEIATCLGGNADENEEQEMLRQAIALSLSEENDEEELLRQAIALSLQD